MEHLAKSVQGNPEIAEEIAKALFGDAAAYEISKAFGFGQNQTLSPKQQREKSERTQARVGLASNIVGLGAGAAGTYEAANKLRGEKWQAANPGRTYNAKPGPISRVGNSARANRGMLKPVGSAAKYVVKNPVKTAAAGLGLQVANVGGDAVANRVLARSAKKDVRKSYDIHPDQVKGKLIKVGSDAAIETTIKGAKKAPEVAARVKQAKRKVVGKSEEFEIRTEIAKTDEDKRLVFGWASIVEKDGKPVVDLQGDYMDIDTIEKAAYTYVTKSRKGGYEHKRNGEEPLHVADLVESLVLTNDKKQALGLPDDTPTGWWTGFRVNDDEVWSDVKKGNVTGFSLHGTGVKKDMS